MPYGALAHGVHILLRPAQEPERNLVTPRPLGTLGHLGFEDGRRNGQKVLTVSAAEFLDSGILVGLDGFEPSTSSMLCKKYQSLAGRNDGNTRLDHAVDATGVVLASGLHADFGTLPHWIGTRSAFTRA